LSSENICTSQKVMEAWVNVFSFIMKSMLPPAINGQTLETEICINTKTEFSSDNMKAQVQEIKYEREKVLSSSRSSSVDFTDLRSVTSKDDLSVDFTDLRSVTSKDDLGFTAPLVPVKPSLCANSYIVKKSINDSLIPLPEDVKPIEHNNNIVSAIINSRRSSLNFSSNITNPVERRSSELLTDNRNFGQDLKNLTNSIVENRKSSEMFGLNQNIVDNKPLFSSPFEGFTGTFGAVKPRSSLNVTDLRSVKSTDDVKE